MKKLTLLVLLISLSAVAQEKETYLSISLSGDIKNALVGSKPTEYKPAADLTIGIHAVSNNFELGAGYERFQAIGFSRDFFNLGYHSQRYIPLGDKEFNFTAVPYVGASLLHRFGKEDRMVGDHYIYGKSSHLAVQVGVSFRAKVFDRIMLDVTSELMSRPDLQYLYPTDNPKSWVLSNSFGIHYILTSN